MKAIEAKGRHAFAFAADVRDANAVAAMVQSARDALGGLDTVVANAGVPTRYEPLEAVEVSYWQRVLDIDLNGVFYTLRAAIPILQAGDGGVILTVSSVGADMCGAMARAAKELMAAVRLPRHLGQREELAIAVKDDDGMLAAADEIHAIFAVDRESARPAAAAAAAAQIMAHCSCGRDKAIVLACFKAAA